MRDYALREVEGILKQNEILPVTAMMVVATRPRFTHSQSPPRLL